MTALAGRRRRATLIVGIATVAVVVVAGALTVLGAVTLYHSTEGADTPSGEPALTFPDTPTGAIAAVDAGGQLASIAVLVLQPSGRGGSIVAVPVSADASGGIGAQRLPLAETVALQGPEALAAELEITLRLQLDAVEVVDAAVLAELLAPVGELEVALPADVTDATGEVVASAGDGAFDAGAAAAVLTARDPAVPGAQQYRAGAAIWSAVATAIGDGLEASDGTNGQGAIGDVAGLMDRLVEGPVGYRSLRATPSSAADNPRQVDVVELDTVELVLVFGQIAPSAVAAPSAGLTFRVVVSYSDEQLAESGTTNTDAAYRALSTLVYVGANVRSVSTTGEPPGERSRLEVADDTLIDGTATTEELFGPLDVVIGDRPIAGVDAILTLGTAYLDLLASGTAPVPSSVPASTVVTEATGG